MNASAITPFHAIMRRAVESTPGAVGGAFADSTGEMVDSFATHHAPHDWAVLTAHYGVILAQLHSAFGIFHFGGPEFFIAQHAKLGIVVHTVEGGYYALMALLPGPDQASGALLTLRDTIAQLQKEMA